MANDAKDDIEKTRIKQIFWGQVRKIIDRKWKSISIVYHELDLTIDKGSKYMIIYMSINLNHFIWLIDLIKNINLKFKKVIQ